MRGRCSARGQRGAVLSPSLRPGRMTSEARRPPPQARPNPAQPSSRSRGQSVTVERRKATARSHPGRATPDSATALDSPVSTAGRQHPAGTRASGRACPTPLTPGRPGGRGQRPQPTRPPLQPAPGRPAGDRRAGPGGCAAAGRRPWRPVRSRSALRQGPRGLGPPGPARLAGTPVSPRWSCAALAGLSLQPVRGHAAGLAPGSGRPPCHGRSRPAGQRGGSPRLPEPLARRLRTRPRRSASPGWHAGR